MIFFFFNQQNCINNQVFAQDKQRPVLQKVLIQVPYIGGTPENKHQQRHPYDQHPKGQHPPK